MALSRPFNLNDLPGYQEMERHEYGIVAVSRVHRINWTIRNFSSMTDFYYESQMFRFDDEDWRLCYYPGNRICVFLQKMESFSECDIECKIGYTKFDGTFVLVEKFSHNFTRDKERRGCIFPSRWELERDGSGLAGFDRLTITCSLEKGPVGLLRPGPESVFGMLPQTGRNFGKCRGFPRLIFPSLDRKDEEASLPDALKDLSLQ